MSTDSISTATQSNVLLKIRKSGWPTSPIPKTMMTPLFNFPSHRNRIRLQCWRHGLDFKRLEFGTQALEQTSTLVAPKTDIQELLGADPAFPAFGPSPHLLPKNLIDIVANAKRLDRVMPQDRNPTPAPASALFKHRLGQLRRFCGGAATGRLQALVHDGQRNH